MYSYFFTYVSVDKFVLCEFIEGDEPEEKIDALLTKLKAQKVL